MNESTRRAFLRQGAAVAGGAAAGAGLGASAVAAATRPLPRNPRTPAAMPTRNLGRTGYSVGIFSLGGQAAVEQPNNEAVAVEIVETALDLGVNYVDTAARYGGDTPWSQTYIGKVMKHRRAEAFLASKTHDRTRDGSLKLLEQSLRLLQTDHLDLWQIHNLQTPEQVEQIFRADGAVAALQQAKEQGLVRHVGVTGHADPAVLIDALSPLPVRHGPARAERRRPAPPELPGEAAAARGREGAGNHRHEDPRPRPPALRLHPAARGRSRPPAAGQGPRHAADAGGAALRALAAREHGDRRLRLGHAAARRTCASRASSTR